MVAADGTTSHKLAYRETEGSYTREEENVLAWKETAKKTNWNSAAYQAWNLRDTTTATETAYPPTGNENTTGASGSTDQNGH